MNEEEAVGDVTALKSTRRESRKRKAMSEEENVGTNDEDGESSAVQEVASPV